MKIQIIIRKINTIINKIMIITDTALLLYILIKNIIKAVYYK